jgi:PAS domain S-box-containing protein
MNRKRTYLMVFAVVVVALAAVVIASVQSWISVRKVFSELNLTDIPILDHASQVSLDISQARTEVFRYVNKYEPSSHRIRKHLKHVRANLLWINQQQLPKNNKNLVETLLVHTDQFQKILNLLESNINKGNSINVLLTANMLKGSGTTLSSLSGKLKDNLWDQIIYENEASQKRILRNNAAMSGISLILIMILVCGVLFQNRVLQRRVHARTVDLEDRLNDLHQSERALQESEAKFRELADLLPQAVFETDIEGRLTYTNQFGFQTFGYTDEDFQIGLNALDMLIPEQRDRAGRRIRRNMAGENLPEEEYMALRKNGTTFPVIIYSNHIQRSGEKLGLRGIIVDISERKQAEEALKENEQRFRELFNNMSSGVAIYNSPDNGESFVFTDLNESGLKNAQKTKDEVIGREVREVFPGVEVLGLFDVFKRVWRTRIPENYPSSMYKDDKLLLWVENYVCKLPSGELVTIYGDTTDQKKAEEAKEQLEKQLRHAHKLESIGNLAGGIAHDFNNILSSVIGFTELALDDVEKGTNIEDSLHEVYAAGKRAKDLVQQILAFARQSDEEMKPIQVDIIVKEVLQLIRSSIPTTIEIKKNIDSDSLIMGNQTQLHQIIMNLCTNAAHAMEDEGGTLIVSLKDSVINRKFGKKFEFKYGDYIEISVSDTGTGIAPEILEKIFEPYFTTKGPGEGSGLGLAMVHGIVESYGGKITVDSKLSEGTTFTVYLPVTRKRKIHRLYEQAELPSGSERILFVDDEAPIAKMGSQTLEGLGYTVSIRTSSIEALELFRTKPNDFDLVITDMTMPNMSGDKLAVELMKIRPDIPVMLCTGFSKKISDDSIETIGIRAVAYKPIVKADLAKTVRKVLDDQQQEQITGRILLIDDESEIRKLFIKKLAGRGYEIIEACDGKEGIKLYHETRPDLVITDLVMPEKEGLETITELKREFPNVKIIAISGGGRNIPDAYLKIAENLNADRTFTKPIDWPEMIKAVRELLK